jgi:hypothetical protein
MRRVKITLGQRQTQALLDIASRGLDEWQYELDDGYSLHGTAAEHREALRVWQSINTALKYAQD